MQISAMSQWALEANRGGVCRKELVPCRRLHQSPVLNAGQRHCGPPRAVASSQDDGRLHRPLARPQKPDQNLTASLSSVGVAAPPAFRPTSDSSTNGELDELVDEACASLDDGGNRKEIVTLFSTKLLNLLDNGQFRPSRLVHMLECVSAVITKAEVHVSLVPESSRLVLELTHRIDDDLQEFSGRELSTIFRSYGKLGAGVIKLQDGDGVGVRETMSHLCLQTESVLHSMDPDQVSQMMWGLANMRFTHCDGLLADVVHRESPRVKKGDFYPRQIATLVWAIGKLGFKKGPMLIRALSRYAKGHMGEFTPQEIMRFLWGISQLGYRGVPSVLVAARNEINRRAEEFSISELIDVTFAFARLSFNPEVKYLNRVGARLCRGNEDLSATDVTKVLYSFAMLGYPSDSVVNWTKDHFRSNWKTYRPQDVASLLWSLAILDALDGDTFARGIDRIVHSSEELNGTGSKQIYQSWLHLMYISGEAVPQGVIPDDLFAKSRKVWLNGARRSPHSETASIMSALEKMGYVCHKQMSTADGNFCVDVFEDSDGQQMVLDVTTLTNSFVNDRDQIRPSRQWFWKAYEKLGFKILNIREDEWKQVPPAARGKFIERRVSAALHPE